ncbi:hypothetical protein SSS_09715 [Sarcoptes scabiei]|nr:hypothetical protein SSS_09715 [Sarcoptes scabiei]
MTKSGLPSTNKDNCFTITRLELLASIITSELMAVPSKDSLYFFRLSSSLSASTISDRDFSAGGLYPGFISSSSCDFKSSDMFHFESNHFKLRNGSINNDKNLV